MQIDQFYKTHAKDRAVTKTLNYLTDLANETNMDISDWELDVIFKGDSAGGLLGSPRELNKRFFQAMKQPKIIPQHPEMKPEELSQISNVSDYCVNLRKRGIQQRIETDTAQIDRLNSQIEAKMLTLREYHEQKNGIINSYEQIIGGILSIGFYSFYRAIEDGLNSRFSFITKDVVMTKKRSDREFRVPFGQFQVDYHPIHNFVRVKRYKNNLVIDGAYWHPFIGREGSCCFGSAEDISRKKLAEGKIVDYFKLLSSLLTTFAEDANPYAQPEKFYYQCEPQEGQPHWRPEDDKLTADDAHKLGVTNPNAILPQQKELKLTDDNNFEEIVEEIICSNCDQVGHSSDNCEYDYCERCGEWSMSHDTESHDDWQENT